MPPSPDRIEQVRLLDGSCCISTTQHRPAIPSAEPRSVRRDGVEALAYPPRLCGQTRNLSFDITSEVLRAIYFRAPVFLRDNYQPGLTPNDQFARSQWAAFLRSLTVFADVLWMNHPKAVYQAEIKPFQLRAAQSVGFRIPENIVTNWSEGLPGKETVVVKTLDTIILRSGKKEGFIYSCIVPTEEVRAGDISTAPVIAQEALVPKVDLRVTVVGSRVFTAQITDQQGNGIHGDWRTQKDDLRYAAWDLPAAVESQCVELVRQLGLTFGGIDLALCGGEYYFIEINPTGEWAWLIAHTDLQIDSEIAGLLAGGIQADVQLD